MKYFVRETEDQRFALEEIIGEDAEGNLYTETIAHSDNRHGFDDILDVLNSKPNRAITA